MLGSLRTAVKFFAYGLAIGLLFAPRSGSETRRELITWATRALSDTARTMTSGSGRGSAGS